MYKRKWINPSGTRAYFAWRSMRNRCYNKQYASYKNYGGRGLSVCARWVDNYDAFYTDMGNPPPGMSLERVDNNGSYSPENCRWATVREQLNNQRRNNKVTYLGKTLTVSQWADVIRVRADTLAHRLSRMPVERALSTTKLREWKHGTRAGYEGHDCRCEACTANNTLRHKLRRERKLNAR